MEAREDLPDLFDLVGSYPIDMEKLCSAVRASADVNAVDDSGQSVLMDAVSPWHDEVSLDLVRLLLEFGADISYEDMEFGNVLSSALYRYEPELIAFLLERGADPNVVMDYWESVLDMAEIDLSHHKDELRWCPDSETNLYACQALTAIIDLLKAAGAKRFDDMVADRPRKWIRMFAGFHTGMTTRDGRLDCEKLPHVTREFCERFRRWRGTHFDTFPEGVLRAMARESDRVAHNEEGRKLAQKIKRMVGNDIAVLYVHVCAEAEAAGRRETVTESI